MRIRITGVLEEAVPARVVFETLGPGSPGVRTGGGQAAWSGPAPEVGSVHHVELDIRDVLVWGRTLRVASEGPGIRAADEGMSLTGTLEIAGSDGGTALRVDGSLVLIELPEPMCAAGTLLTILASEAVLFPFTL